MRIDYLMESPEEAYRLDVKTDPKLIEVHAQWAGIRPGMRVLDVGCGAGKTTAVLHSLVQPNGCALGIDASPERIAYAREHYGSGGVTFHCIDARDNLTTLGTFDFVWIRFLLQYYPIDSGQIITNVSSVVAPGGILALVDLEPIRFDGLSGRLERTIHDIVQIICEQGRYDPLAGKRLLPALQALGYVDIDELIVPYHQIKGDATDTDVFNWMTKATVLSQKINYGFPLYELGFTEFIKEFEIYFHSPQRSIHTPLICCRGTKPS